MPESDVFTLAAKTSLPALASLATTVATAPTIQPAGAWAAAGGEPITTDCVIARLIADVGTAAGSSAPTAAVRVYAATRVIGSAAHEFFTIHAAHGAAIRLAVDLDARLVPERDWQLLQWQ